MRSRSSSTHSWGTSGLAAAATPTYLAQLAPSVRAALGDTSTLAALQANVVPLTQAERVTIVRQALILIEQNYAHLPLKRAMHAVDPVQRLKLLLQELEGDPDAYKDSDLAFHNELTDIFTSLRDLHTNYLLPDPYAAMTAFLPFMVEDCYQRGQCTYLVSHIVEGFTHDTFVRGVEIVYWNGTPISRAVQVNAERFAGSNREARHARGVQTLTTRPLRVALPPDEEWVIVGYRALDGKLMELRFDWVVNPMPADLGAAPLDDHRASALIGVDLQQRLVQRARAALFAPHAKESGEKAAAKLERGQSLGKLESRMPEVIQARSVATKSGTFGYVRIRTFDAEPAAMVNEFVRLVSALPKRGLIIDVRGNGGGVIRSGEYLLQLLTPKSIEPEPVQFINTSLNLQICDRNGRDSAFADLSPWTDSMRQALQTGSTFSAGFPISEPAMCNVIGQRYFGPVVLITDALCYSTTDIFSAGFQDHEIGPVLGTAKNTGAGGANVWEQDFLVQAAFAGDGSPYEPLPQGAGMRVAMRRSLRVGKRSGTPVEDLGVVPDQVHQLTRADILEDNVDLRNAAGALLSKLPVRELRVRLVRAKGLRARLGVSARGIDRLDVYVEQRPLRSIEPVGRSMEVDVEVRAPATDVVELRGFSNGELVARFRVSWREIAHAAGLGAKSTRAAKANAKSNSKSHAKTKSRSSTAATDDAEPFGGWALEQGSSRQKSTARKKPAAKSRRARTRSRV